MTNDVTKIENARALKAMGMPLNLPITERTFAPKSSRLWFGVVRDGRKFLEQTIQYEGGNPTHAVTKRGNSRSAGYNVQQLPSTDTSLSLPQPMKRRRQGWRSFSQPLGRSSVSGLKYSTPLRTVTPSR